MASANLDLRAYRACRLCPRECRADRTRGQATYCGETATCRVAAAEPHFGEEPCFTAQRGSGTIFFTGCSSGCFFCQNYQISHEGLGRPITPRQLVNLAWDLADRGVHNINFVTPDHFWPHVRFAAEQLRRRGATLPFVFNCSGYERPALVDEYAEVVDIFMPDFKFAQPELAQACMGDRRYPEIALAAIAKMVERKGFLEPWDPKGRRPARRGVLVRHLVLPGYVENTVAALRLLRREFGRWLPISLMAQFTPVPACRVARDMTRALRKAEYDIACRTAQELGFEHVFVQQPSRKRPFLPDFRQARPFRGNIQPERLRA